MAKQAPPSINRPTFEYFTYKGPHRVAVGDAVLTGNGESHAILNDGEEPLELMAFIACSATSSSAAPSWKRWEASIRP